MALILVLDPAVSLVIWMAKAHFLVRPLQTLKVPGYILKIMFQKCMKPRENETQQGKRTRRNSRNKTKHSGPILTNESIFYVFIKNSHWRKRFLQHSLQHMCILLWPRLVTYSSNNEIFWQNNVLLNVHFVYQRKQIFAAELHNIVLTIYGNFSMTLAYL